MRNALRIFLVLLLFATIGATSALADTFTYTLTYTLQDGSTFSFTTGPLDPAIALGNPQTAIITDSFTGFYSGTTLVAYVLDGSDPMAPGANLLVQVTGGPLLGPPESFFAPSDYTSPGTYSGTCADNCVSGATDTLTVTLVPTPEPSTYGLLLAGIGLLLVMRKRFTQGLQQPS